MDSSIDQLIFEAVINKRYPQNSLLTSNWFTQHVNKRSRTHITEGDLEEMDKTGLFHPLFKVETPFSYHRIATRNGDDTVSTWEPEPLHEHEPDDENVVQVYGDAPASPEEWRQAVNDGRIEFPTASNFKLWDTHHQRMGGRRASRRIHFTTVYYHPYQVFRALEAMKLLVARLTMSEEPDTADIALEWIQRSWKHMNAERERFVADNEWKRALLLYVLIEDRYVPAIRGSVAYANFVDSEGENWYEWSERFKPNDSMTISEFTVDDVQRLRRVVAIECRRHDENFHWFPLVRHMERAERERCGKSTLLAWDYYEINEMLGDFLADVTGERQPLPDDVLQSGNWKAKAYNFPVEEMNYKTGNALPGILRHSGLDPRSRVWVFVEGMTEYSYVERWFAIHGISLPTSRIELVSLDTHMGVKSDAFKRQARGARIQNAAVYFLIDDDGNRGDRLKHLQEWINQGYIGRIFDVSELSEPDLLPIGALIWTPCFEDQNFSFDEQVAAWKYYLTSQYGEQALDEHEIAAATEAARPNSKLESSIKAIESVASGQFRRRLLKSGTAAKFSKPQIGIALAEVHHDLDNPINRLLPMIHHIASLETAVYRPDAA